MEYSFLFPLMQKLYKSIKKCQTYSRKATGLFFQDTVYKSPGDGDYDDFVCVARCIAREAVRRVDS